MYTHVDTVTVVVVYITVAIYSYVATMNYFHIDNTFVRLLQCRLKRSYCSSDSAMRDIYDGSIYKGDSEFFSNPNNLSFIMNFDGAPEFKSSTMQIWPIQMLINELPPLARYDANIDKELASTYVIIFVYIYIYDYM